MSVTLQHRLNTWAKEDPYGVVARTRVEGNWRDMTIREYWDGIYYLACFLESKGISKSSATAIYSYNRPEWVTLELATTMVGAKSVGIYPNSTMHDLLYILEHTEAEVLGIQDEEYYNRLRDPSGKSQVPERVKLLIVFQGDAAFSTKAIRFQDAVEEGKELAKKFGEGHRSKLLSELNPDDGAYLIYTSGTTGRPKGVLLTHDNLVYAADTFVKTWGLPRGGSLFSFLPLCHIAEKMHNMGVGITCRYSVHYCSKFENVALELPTVQPTLMLAVPRVWEKFMEGVESKLCKAPPAKQKLARWAMDVTRQATEDKLNGRISSPFLIAKKATANILVISKIRRALGLENTLACASGAAWLGEHIVKWFWGIGVEIMQVYSQSESAAVFTMTEAGKDQSGTVGIPAPGTDFKIADDGELCTRGRHVFAGYFKDPEATAATMDSEKWLHSGDLGSLDSRGCVVVKGRKKEILKTSGGKMIAPSPIEEKLKAAGVISQACLVGDNRKYISAIFTLTEDRLNRLRTDNGKIENGFITDEKVRSEVNKVVQDLNGTLASFEQVKKFVILGREFSIVDGEMTPTMKMKRRVIEDRFQKEIDAMYE